VSNARLMLDTLEMLCTAVGFIASSHSDPQLDEAERRGGYELANLTCQAALTNIVMMRAVLKSDIAKERGNHHD